MQLFQGPTRARGFQHIGHPSLREAIVAEAVERRGGGVSRQTVPVFSSWLESC